MNALNRDFAAGAVDLSKRVDRLERQIAREKRARIEAEAIAERGLRDLYESQRRLTLLQKITNAANNAEDVLDALQFAVREISCHMGWDFGNAYLIDQETCAAQACDCWFAAQPDQLFPFVEASRRAEFGWGDGLPGRVLRDGRPHWIKDVRNAEGFYRAGVASQTGLASACAFPILVGDQVVALLEFFTHKTIRDHANIVAVMGQIGTQLGRVVERDMARKALLHDALHDSLTGLGNRLLLAERGKAATRHLGPDGKGLALLVIDLDGFKAVNDRYGHLTGDTLLVEVAGRLRDSLAVPDAPRGPAHGGCETSISRVGGDEFVVLVERHAGPACLDALARRIHATLQQPFLVGAETATVGASIGIACSDEHCRDLSQILRDADLAMYAAKAKGRGNTVWFTSKLGELVRNRAALEQELRAAIDARQFILHYQPIIAMDECSRVIGFEALVRWQHPRRGLLSPAEFVPQAEASGLIIFIGDWVLEAACRAMSALHRELPGCDRPFISINIAPTQFLQPNFAERVRDVIMVTGIDPRLVRLEVTEGVAIIDAERTAKVLNEIREWGVHTSLDDFGTGYSSLSYLQTLPFDCLKIDRSFVAAIANPRSRSIIGTIMSLASNMDMSVVAEGIESDEQREALEQLGCRVGQGYLYGQPCLPEEAFALVKLRGPIVI